MKRSSILALGGASMALAVAPSAALAGQKVSVHIEGARRTLQAPRIVQIPRGSVTKFGAPAGACPARSALGVLNATTHGRWKGKYYTTYSDYLIGSVLGEAPNPKTGYWGIWVDNRYATTGACDIKLRAGDDVLFAVDSAKKHEHPLGVTAPRTAKAGAPLTLRAVSYSDAGRATPQAGVSFKGVKGTTDKAGKLTVAAPPARKAPMTFTGSEKGYIRASATVRIS